MNTRKRSIVRDNRFIFPGDVQGWFWPKEGRAFYKLVQKNHHLGVVVELGSYHGKSTICPAQGSKKINDGKVYAIDNFIGDKYTGLSGNFFQIFKKNIKKYELMEWVASIKGDFSEIAETWKKPIRLLFIDGSHDYEQIKRDFENWQKFVVPGGIIALHDGLVWPGVTKFIKELIQSRKFKNFRTVNNPGSLTYMTRLSESKKISQQDMERYWDSFNNLARKRAVKRLLRSIKNVI